MENRRKQYFVKKKLQFRYMMLVLFAMLIPSIVCSTALYYVIWQTVAAEVAVPEAIAESLIPALNSVNLILLIALPIVFILMLLASIMISHRIAGPLYRLEKELKKIEEGDYSRRIELRSGDELQEIAEGVNSILDKLKEQGKL